MKTNKTDSALFLELTQELLNMKEATADDYKSLIAVLIKELGKLLSANHKVSDVDFDMVETYYDLLCGLLLQFAYSKTMSRSFLREAWEPLRSFIENRLQKGKIPEAVERIVGGMLDWYKRIVITSFYHCAYEVGRQEIEDFLAIALLLQIENFSGAVVRKHTKYVVDLLTWIFNLLQFGKIDKNYLTYVPSMLSSLEFGTIVVYDVETELYDAGVNPGTMHKFYTRNYYIAMILLYCEATKKYRTQELVTKLRYVGTPRGSAGWAYKNVLGGLENIVKADFIAVMPDYRDEFESAKERVVKMLSPEIKKIDGWLPDMETGIDYEKVKSTFSERKREILAEFDSLADKTSDYEQLRPIETQIEVIYREVANDSPFRVGTADYYPQFFDTLFDKYINNGQLSVRDIPTLDALPCKDGETLFAPHALYDKLWEMANFQSNQNGGGVISLGQKKIDIEFVRHNVDFVVLKSDFNKAFAKPEMNDAASTIKEQNMADDILFSTYVYLIFSQNKAMDFPAYRIKELRAESK